MNYVVTFTTILLLRSGLHDVVTAGLKIGNGGTQKRDSTSGRRFQRRVHGDSLANYELIVTVVPPLSPGFEPFMAHAQRRYLRGELLMALGRYTEALPWFASLGSLSVPESPFRGLAHLRQAEIYERLGNRAEAAKYYQQVLELWRDADLEVRPMRDAARQHLAALH